MHRGTRMTESTRKIHQDTLWDSTRHVPVTDIILHTNKCTWRSSAVSERGNCTNVGLSLKGLAPNYVWRCRTPGVSF